MSSIVSEEPTESKKEKSFMVPWTCTADCEGLPGLVALCTAAAHEPVGVDRNVQSRARVRTSSV